MTLPMLSTAKATAKVARTRWTLRLTCRGVAFRPLHSLIIPQKRHPTNTSNPARRALPKTASKIVGCMARVLEVASGVASTRVTSLAWVGQGATDSPTLSESEEFCVWLIRRRSLNQNRHFNARAFPVNVRILAMCQIPLSLIRSKGRLCSC